MKVNNEIKKIMLINSFIYILMFWNTYLFKFEKDNSNLKNGLLITILFYSQIIIILANIIIIRKNKMIFSSKLSKLMNINLVFRGILFIIYNILLVNIPNNIPILIKYLGIIIFFIIDIGFMYYIYKNIGKFIKDNIEYKKIIVNEDLNFSLSGILLYFLSILIFNPTNEMLIIKVLLFYYSIKKIYENLNINYKIKSIKNKISISLIIGAIVNIIAICLIDIFSESLKVSNYIVIKDSIFIFSMLFIFPYLKKYVY